MTDAQSAMYAGIVSEKVKDAHQRRVRERRVNGGGRMFGERSETEREAVKALARMTLEGKSLKEMTRWLNGEGFKTTRGNRWRSTTLRGLLTNPRLKGVLVSKGEEIGPIAEYQPILDAETWQKMQGMLEYGIAPTKPGRPTLILTPLLRCSSCGGGMRGGSNGKVRHYRCDTDRPCDRRMVITAHHADEYVWGQTLLYMRSLPTEPEHELDTGAILADIAAIEQRLAELDEDYDSGRIDRKRWVDRNGKLCQERDALRARLNGSIRPTILDLFEGWKQGEVTRQEIEEFLVDELGHIKATINMYVEKVTVYPPTQAARRGFDPNRLEITWRSPA